MNKPKGSRTHRHLTRAEKKKIVGRLRRGAKQIEVAREFGCLESTIKSVREAAGVSLFAELTPELEAKAVALLREGVGFMRVGKMTRLPRSTTKQLMIKHRIVHRVGDPGLPLKKHAKILERVLRRDDFGVSIAEKEGVSDFTVLRIAHQIFGPHRFRNRGLPLTSAVNPDSAAESNLIKYADKIFRKHFHAEAHAMQYETIWRQFVEGYLDRNYCGVLPPDRAALVSEVMAAIFPDSVKHLFPIKSEIAGYIKKAVDSIASTQSGLVH
jgi:transposase-like protein